MLAVYFRISRPKASRNVGGRMAAVMVNHPLTMIKSTLAAQFYLISQADRMSCGTLTCGQGSPSANEELDDYVLVVRPAFGPS